MLIEPMLRRAERRSAFGKAGVHCEPPDAKANMARSSLRLALVSCPVALYNARHDRGGIRFNLINPETGNRIRMITQDAETGREVERRDLVKGYEFRKNQYVLLSDADLDSVRVVGDDDREVRGNGFN